MVLTREELVANLKQEVRIFVHLAGKVEPSMLDYRPSRTQRSTLELLQYMAIMGPTQIVSIESGDFSRAALGAVWSPAEKAAKELSFEQAVAAIQGLSEKYARLGDWSEDFWRAKVDLFGTPFSRAALIVNQVIAGHAAYRTQLFCYLKSCGRDELNTVNLWVGMDHMKSTT